MFLLVRRSSPRAVAISLTCVALKMPEKASHPKYLDMVKEAIRKNYSVKGTSRQKIKSFIEQTYHIQALNSILRATLEKAATEGVIEKTSDGSRYRLTSKGRLSMEKKKEKKIRKPAKVTKSAVKKATTSKAKKPRKAAVKVKKVIKPSMKKTSAPKAKKLAKPSKKASGAVTKKSAAKPAKKVSMKKAPKPSK